MLTESLLIGILSISSIGLREPVFLEPDHQQCVNDMKVCAYAGFPRVLAAHDYGAFSRLHELQVGDRFRYARRVYTVERVKIVNEGDVGVLRVPRGQISLQTCVANPRHRLLVTATEGVK